MQTHCNAATTARQRLFVQNSKESCRTLARQLCASHTTVARWKSREDTANRSCRPTTVHYAFTPAEETIVLVLRQAEFSLRSIQYILRQVLSNACVSSLHRLLVRHGQNRRIQPKESPEKFRDYPPGFLHIDLFYLPRIGGTFEFCFVAIDRATRTAFAKVYPHKSKACATDFLKRCIEFFPFGIHTILTDNGPEFTQRFWERKDDYRHPFEEAAQVLGIRHKHTLPSKPRTNGMVERLIGMTKQSTTKAKQYANRQEMIEDILSWFRFYNLGRHHGSLENRTPMEQLELWYKQAPELFTKQPSDFPRTVNNLMRHDT